MYLHPLVSISPLQRDNPSTCQVWHIKNLIKQRDHYTGAPCAVEKRPLLKCVVVSMCQCLKLRECLIDMLTAGMSTRAVARISLLSTSI